MEYKKLNKLVLKKEHVSNLNDRYMNLLHGGYDDSYYCTNTVNPGSCKCDDTCTYKFKSAPSCPDACWFCYACIANGCKTADEYKMLSAVLLRYLTD